MSITFDLIPWHALTGGFVIGIAVTLLLFLKAALQAYRESWVDYTG